MISLYYWAKYGVKTLIFPLLILFFSGCWSRRELENLGIVAGLGIDLSESGQSGEDGGQGEILLTAQIIKPGEVRGGTQTGGGGGGGGGGGKKSPVWVTQSRGSTVFDAVRNFTFRSSRRLYFSHNQVIVLSREAAERGVYPLLDIFIRDPEPRITEWVLISEEKAAPILEAESELETIPAIGLSRLMENYFATSQVAAVNLHDFMARLMSKTSAPFAPMIGLDREKDEFILGETAVFKGDRLVGKLNKEETRGLLWVTGEVRGGIITVAAPEGRGRVSLEIIRAERKISPELKAGEIRVKVEIREEGNLGEQMTSEDLSIPEKMAALNRRQAEAIKKEVLAAVKKARELKADIFGFGEAVRRKYPKEWKEMEPRWEELFPRIKVGVMVRSELRRVGITLKPAVPK